MFLGGDAGITGSTERRERKGIARVCDVGWILVGGWYMEKENEHFYEPGCGLTQLFKTLLQIALIAKIAYAESEVRVKP